MNGISRLYGVTLGESWLHSSRGYGGRKIFRAGIIPRGHNSAGQYSARMIFRLDDIPRGFYSAKYISSKMHIKNHKFDELTSEKYYYALYYPSLLFTLRMDWWKDEKRNNGKRKDEQKEGWTKWRMNKRKDEKIKDEKIKDEERKDEKRIDG